MRGARDGGLRIDGIVVALTVYVLRALGLGDLLTAVPALRGLRRHYPDAVIVLAAPAAYRDLALLTGAVDEVVPTAGLGDVHALDQPPMLGVNLHGAGPQSIEHLLAVAPLAMLTHRHPDHPEVPGPDWPEDVHEVDRWCGLLRWAGIACSADDLDVERPPRDPVLRDAVVIHPGAAAPSRRWPADRFATVAAELAGEGYDVVVTGSRAERDLAQQVADSAGLPESAVLAGELDLLDLVTLVADARLLVCGDTGVAHVATATGTESVLLFGPTPPSRWGPRRLERHHVLWAGDVGDPHADHPDPGLLSLSTAEVLDTVRTALKESS
jgi:ADP-heptose:LPS heptosyltransferase